MKNLWKSISPLISQLQIHNAVHTFTNLRSLCNPHRRLFSSDPAVEFKISDIAIVADIFSKPLESNEILSDLESRKLALDQDVAYSALRSLEGDPGSARRFFDWASSREGTILRSKSYNLMLRILATKGDSREFWDLVKIMKRKGFGISKETHSKVCENFESDGNGSDVSTRLKEVYVQNASRMCSKICNILKGKESSEEMHKGLLELNIPLDQDIVYSVLRSLEGDTGSARRFLDWVSNREDKVLGSKSYNLMLRILATKGDSVEFWDLFEIMKRKGFGILKKTYKVCENLESDGKGNDLVTRLKDMYVQNAARMGPRICKILKETETTEEIHKSLLELNIALSSELIVYVLESIGSNPDKALVFFEWVRDQQHFNIDGTVYNAIAKVLVREDCLKKFWHVLHQMRNAGYRMESRTYFTVLGSLHKRKMISAAVDLYEFAMTDPGKLVAGNFLRLLKRIVVSEDLDMNLISRVVSIFINSGNKIKHSHFNEVLESLTSVGRLAECGNILKSMEEGGFEVDDSIHSEVIAGLCKVQRFDAACEYVKNLEKNGSAPNSKSWVSLVESHALAGEVDKAGLCFCEMVEKKGCERDKGRAFHVLVTTFCKMNREMDAFEVLKEMVEKRNFRPMFYTYSFLIKMFVNRGSMKEAVGLLELMTEQEFSPFVEPFITHMSKSGSVDDAMGFLNAMTDKKLPSTVIFLRLFRVLMESGRHEVANDILSKSPVCVQKHADILDIFDSLKTNEVSLA